MRAPEAGAVLAFAHLGDLHITDAQQANFADLLAIVAQIETQAHDGVDFVVLPGDCADNGLPGQYALIATALRMLSLPIHVIPGDHDMEQGSLANFHAGLQAPPLPKRVSLPGHRCLFLDFCSPGAGGPDFRLGEGQLDWLAAELSQAEEAAEETVLFMHSYPADLRGDGEIDRLNRLLARHRVALVDMGHTHYNELANDGSTIFAATRSTGQRDEGPVGFSLVTIDGGVVSWRFKPLDDPFPFVMITTPADHRLMRGAAQRLGEGMDIGARIFGAEPVARVDFRVDDGPWQPMERAANGADWRASFTGTAGRLTDITVRAVTADGRPGQHAIRAAGLGYDPVARQADGSDAATIGAWPENGILGTQLGPNRNGRKW